MFDLVHKNKRIVQILLILIVLPFALWGIESYQRFSGGADHVALVDGDRISTNDLNEAMQRQLDQMRQALGRNFDASMFDTPQARAQMLDGLIAQRLAVMHVTRRNFQVSDDELRQVIASEPAFQDGGAFSKSRYETLLAAQNLTPQIFEASLRRDMMLQQLAAGLLESSFVASTAARQYAAIRAEQREVSDMLVEPAAFTAQVKIQPDAVEKYYREHAKEFEIPEQVKAQYVVLSGDALASQIKIPEEDLRAWYKQNLDRYRQPEQRQASHILIAASDAKARPEAKKKAEALLQELRKSPEKFAELARKNSDDPGSKDKGGDLGYFGRGSMVKPFEDTVFSLKLNRISDLVETEFGYHIIRLTGVRPEKVTPFEEVRAGIEDELRKQRTAKKVAEAAESFANIAEEQPDSLQPLVEKFGLKIETSPWIGKTPSPAAGVLNNPRVLAALFAADAVKDKHNTDAIEVSSGTMVVARVAEHKPATQPPLDEVKKVIQDKLTRIEAAELARKAGAERLEALRNGKEVAGAKWSVARMVTRENPAGLAQDGIKAVFKAGSAKLPAYVGVDLADGGYAIYRIGRVSAGAEPDENRVRAIAAALARQASSSDYQAFIASLRSHASIEINKANLERKGS